MVSRKVRALHQHRFIDVPLTVMVLFVLAARYASERSDDELVLNDVWRYSDSSSDILHHPGKARVYWTRDAGEERVKKIFQRPALRCLHDGMYIS